MDMRKLLTRSLSGLIYVGLIVGALLLGVPGTAALACVLGLIALLEFDKITGTMSGRALPATLLDSAGVVLLCLSWWRFTIVAWIVVLLLRGVVELYLKDPQPQHNLARSVFAQIYVGLPMGLMLWITGLTGTTMTVLLLFIMIWVNDTGAFLVGSLCGRRRMFERISPKKSWEGFFGGLCLNIIAAVVLCLTCASFFGLAQQWVLWVSLAVCVTAFATWGDLLESLIKRTLGIKDSGNWIPGHGGILDRIDSLLFVMPSAFAFLWLLYN